MMEKRLSKILGNLQDHEILDLLEQLGHPPHSRNEAWVYIISTSDRFPCKIGWAKDPEKRRKYMQAYNPDELYLQFCVESQWARRVESHAKRLLKNHQRRPKHEWYDVDVDTAVSVIKKAVTICADPIQRGEKANFFDRLNLHLFHPDYHTQSATRPPHRRKLDFLQ